VVAIKKQKLCIFLTATLLTLLMITSVTAYSISFNVNDFRSQDLDDIFTYSLGYDTGYDDAKASKASNPFTMVNKYMRVYKDDPDYIYATFAHHNKQEFTKGYRDGHADGKAGAKRVVEEDFMEDYINIGLIEIEEEAKESKNTGSLASDGWDVDSLDLSDIGNLGYDIGYSDAINGKSKAPLKFMVDLSKTKDQSVRKVLAMVRAERGTFITNYKAGYEFNTKEKAGTIVSSKINGQNSNLPSQQSSLIQKESAWDLGYEIGYAKAMAHERSSPHEIDNYEWVINRRYHDESSYTLPIIAGVQITREKLQIFAANRASYLKGYREGYATAEAEMDKSVKEMSDSEFVFDLGCQVAREGKNVFTYNWNQRVTAQTTEDLDMVRLVRYNRGELLKGFRSCQE
jgi:hypothetical protein